MAPEGLPLVVTSSLGFGVFAGVVSSICYVFLQGYRRKRSRSRKVAVLTKSQCCVCGAHFTPVPLAATLDVCPSRESTFTSQKAVTCWSVRCSGCDGRCCKVGRCSVYDEETQTWSCVACYRGGVWGILASWPATITSKMSRAAAKFAGTSVQAVSSRLPRPVASSSSTSKKGKEITEDKEVVRDFIERLVGAMLHADIDDSSVNRLYKDAEYLPVTGHTPCTAHEALKNIIRRVLRDASKLVPLQQPNEQEVTENREGQTYEDLLATAILNKVIDNYQNDLSRSSSSSSSSRKEKDETKPSKTKKSKSASKNKVELEDPWKPQEIDSTSVSSVEDWCRSDCSWGEKTVDPVTLTIKHSIEELSSTSSSDLPSSFLTPGPPSLDREEWQDNWLFSKRGSPKPVPVPMLVPSPNTELRTMIGDKDAEDTSDLSETGSDVDDSVEVNSLKNILVDSRTIIGGKNLLDNINLELLEPHDHFKDNSIPVVHVHAEVIINGYHNGDTTSLDDEETLENGNIQENGTDDLDGHIYKEEEVEEQKVEDSKCNGSENGFSEAKNDVIISETPYVESDSLGSNTEKDAEYTEKYASFPRPIKKKSPVPSPRISVTANDETEINDVLEQNGVEQNSIEEQHVSSEEEDPPVSFEGSYSAREKEKWKNPIALKNNPYSKENLDKRLQTRANNSIFDREYYIRDAKKSASGKENEAIEVSSNDFQSLKSPSLTSSTEFAEDNIEIESEVLNQLTDGVVQNSVSQSQDREFHSEVDSSMNSDFEIKIARPISLILSSDEDNDIKRIYNVETGTIHKYKASDITKEIREDAKSPIGLKNSIGIKNTEDIFSPTVNEKFDENHNNSYENENIFDPEMKITSIQNLETVPVLNVPANEENRNYEEKVASIDLSDEYSLDSQKETLSSIENVEIRDVSKKYLNSLVKNKPYTVNIISSPEVCIREVVPDRKSVLVQSNLVKNEVKSQSCIDLSQKQQHIQIREPILSSKLVSKFMKSVPNVNECFDSTTTDSITKNRSVNILEAEGIAKKPSVKDLMKLFDKKDNQENKQNTSHLNVPTSSPKHVHSLTARSLPAGVRKELKIGTNEIDISARSGHTTVPIMEELKHISGISRSKIQFFEGLKP